MFLGCFYFRGVFNLFRWSTFENLKYGINTPLVKLGNVADLGLKGGYLILIPRYLKAGWEVPRADLYLKAGWEVLNPPPSVISDATSLNILDAIFRQKPPFSSRYYVFLKFPSRLFCLILAVFEARSARVNHQKSEIPITICVIG